MDDADVDVEELMRQAEALEAEALPPKSISAQEERDVIDAAERLAGSEAGVPAKSRAVIQSMTVKWLDFLDRHSEGYGFDAACGPTEELVKKFQS